MSPKILNRLHVVSWITLDGCHATPTTDKVVWPFTVTEFGFPMVPRSSLVTRQTFWPPQRGGARTAAFGEKFRRGDAGCGATTLPANSSATFRRYLSRLRFTVATHASQQPHTVLAFGVTAIGSPWNQVIRRDRAKSLSAQLGCRYFSIGERLFAGGAEKYRSS